MSTSKHELTITFNEAYSFWKVTCPVGDYISTFNPDTDDPKDYYGGKEVYLPKFFTEDQIRESYHCITEAEHEDYIAARDMAMEEYDVQLLEDADQRPVVD